MSARAATPDPLARLRRDVRRALAEAKPRAPAPALRPTWAELAALDEVLARAPIRLVRPGAPGPRWALDVLVPVRTLNVANAREHHMARVKRVANERAATARHLEPHAALRPAFPVVVRLTRVSRGKPDDDGAVIACKAVRDEVAAFLGVDDADDRIAWEYAIDRGAWGVRVQIAARWDAREEG